MAWLLALHLAKTSRVTLQQHATAISKPELSQAIGISEQQVSTSHCYQQAIGKFCLKITNGCKLVRLQHLALQHKGMVFQGVELAVQHH